MQELEFWNVHFTAPPAVAISQVESLCKSIATMRGLTRLTARVHQLAEEETLEHLSLLTNLRFVPLTISTHPPFLMGPCEISFSG